MNHGGDRETAMRVLFATTAGAGHFAPLAPFIAACRRRGHEVMVAAPESFRPAVERAGFPFWPCADLAPELWGAIQARLPSLSFDEANRVIVGEVFAGLDARATLPGMQAAVERWRPDVVVRETAEFGSCVAADLAGIPQVRVAIGLGSNEEWAAGVAAEHLAPLREEVGLPGDPQGDQIRSTPLFSGVPPLMDDSAGSGTVLRFRDPVAGATELPGWWDDDPNPLVYVTFGTVAPGMPGIGDLYREVLGALAGLPIRLLATVGEGADPGSLPVAPNVHVERWYPQAQVLPQVSAMVCHGGFGTVHGGLAAGIPMVLVPFFADQPLNAARVAALGAGVVVAPPSPSAVREALLRVLDDEAFTVAAGRVADDYRSLPPADDAVGVLERLAG